MVVQWDINCSTQYSGLMAKWGEGDPRWIVEERADATNVNNWHWCVCIIIVNIINIIFYCYRYSSNIVVFIDSICLYVCSSACV